MSMTVGLVRSRDHAAELLAAGTGSPWCRWAGTGVKTLGIEPGNLVDPAVATKVFVEGRHPSTSHTLRVDPRQVLGIDLQFQMPEPAIRLWHATHQEPAAQAQILESSRAAVAAMIEELDRKYLTIRVGGGLGLPGLPSRGCVAARLDCWDSHVLVLGSAQHPTQDRWGPIDTDPFWKSGADEALSERHENRVLDEVHDRLGIDLGAL